MKENDSDALSSMSSFLRRLAMRIIRALPSRNGATTARRLKLTSAVGRAKRAKKRPVMSACASTPTSASAVMSVSAGVPAGLMLPYPMVANVSTEKKKARPKVPPIVLGSGPVMAASPHNRKSTANSTLMPR